MVEEQIPLSAHMLTCTHKHSQIYNCKKKKTITPTTTAAIHFFHNFDVEKSATMYMKAAQNSL